MMKKRLSLLLALILSSVMILSGCSDSGYTLSEMIAMVDAMRDYYTEPEILPTDDGTTLREDGEYSSKSEDGYIYCTEDHYENFEQLYP